MIRPAANASAYPAVIHWMAPKEAPRSRSMLGIAMLTIVASTRSMKAAVMTMARAIQRRLSLVSVGAASVVTPSASCALIRRR